MKPGPELDALIAENIMGMYFVSYTKDDKTGLIDLDTWVCTNSEGNQQELPKYSTNILDAMKIVERLQSLSLSIKRTPDYEYCVRFGGYSPAYSVDLAHAIGLAALNILEFKE